MTTGVSAPAKSDGWNVARLGDICDVKNGFGFPPKFQGRTDLPYPFFKVSDMNADGAEVTLTVAANTVDSGILREIRGRTFAPGTVVFPKVGGAVLTNKKRILGVESTIDNNVMAVTPRDVDPAWLYYWFLTVDLVALSNTQALPSIRQSTIEALEVPLPPLGEQRRIAGILKEQMEAVERARVAAEAQLEAAKALPAAFLRDVFNSNDVAKHDAVTLGDLCTVVRGSSPRPKGDPRYYGEGVPRLMVEDCTRDGMFVSAKVDSLTEEGATHSRPMKAGDVVIVVSGNPGLPAILAHDCCIHDGFVGLRSLQSDRISNQYLYLFLQFVKASTDAQATGAIFRNLTTDQIKATNIVVPPLDVQERLCDELQQRKADAELLLARVTEQADLVTRIPAALLRHAFSGQL